MNTGRSGDRGRTRSRNGKEPPRTGIAIRPVRRSGAPDQTLVLQPLEHRINGADGDSAPRLVLDFLPDARALRDSGLFFREVVGIGWYYLRSLVNR